METKHYDAIIIGLGLTGSWAAKELSENGMNVVGIDAGPLLENNFFENRWNKKEFLNINTYLFIIKSLISKNFSYANKALMHRAESIYIKKNESPYLVLPEEPFDLKRIRAVGGRGITWGRVCPRYTDKEFQSLTLDGCGVDWPIKSTDLNIFYDEVETLLELGGAPSKSGRMIDGQFVHKRSLNDLELKFKSLIESNWPKRIFDVNHVVEYEPGPLNPMMLKAVETKNLTIKTETIIKKILTDSNGNAKGIEFLDKKLKKEGILNTDLIILTASPFESIRILLSSKSNKHPNGIGNTNGLVGKKILEHIKTTYYGILPEKLCNLENTLNPFKLNSDRHGFYISPFRKLEEKNFNSESDYSIWGNISPSQKIISVYSFGKSIPKAENRICLDGKMKDKWGIPIPRIEFKWSKNEIKMWLDQKKTISEMIKCFENGMRVKIKQNFSHLSLFNNEPIPGSAIHECGGAVMGTNPKNSVINKYNRIWDCPNIIVGDAASFPSLGYQNIALTAMALCLRASRNIIETAKKKVDLYKI